jgi:hypothetical protein
MSGLREFLAKIPGLRSEADRLAATGREMRDALEKARRRREFLQAAPLCASDVEALIAEWIDGQADAFAQHLKKSARFVSVERHVPRGPGGALLDPAERAIPLAIIFGAREKFKEAVRQTLAELDWSDAGPPTPARVEELTELEQRIPELEREVATFIDEMDRVGVTFSGLAALRPGKEKKPATPVIAHDTRIRASDKNV